VEKRRDESPERTRRRRRKAPIAAFWSFLFPGAGQLYNHQPGLAALLAVPVLLLIGLGILSVVLLQSSLLARLLDSRVIVALVVLNVAVLGWRLLSMLQAHRFRARFKRDRVGTWVTGLLVAVTIGMHAVPAVYAFLVLDTLSSVSLGGQQGSEAGGGVPAIRPVGERLPRPSVIPQVERGERVNVLLVGIDSGAGRDHALTDTMLVVSLDADGDSAMLSVPRDLVNAPLPNGEPYPNKLNSLLQTANADPATYPLGGVGTLKATISNLLGVPIHYLAAVDMVGFQRMIDAVGGVVVNVEQAVADPRSDLFLEPGPVFMDGELALRFVRSRYGAGNDDFVRADRQQQLIAALRNTLAQSNLLVELPGLLDAVQSTIASDVPQDRIPDLAQAIQNVDMGSLEREVIQPPLYVTPATGAGGAYILIPDLDAIRDLGQELLGE
jgi:polyisoprenyl-teichoic acid--peptidoglycan teichoic acid transferase